MHYLQAKILRTPDKSSRLQIVLLGDPGYLQYRVPFGETPNFHLKVEVFSRQKALSRIAHNKGAQKLDVVRPCFHIEQEK
jgi:hypothetical protein